MMQYASFTGLVKTILIIMLVWYGMKILSRLFAPALMRFVAKKAEQRFGQQYKAPNAKTQSNKKEGEISIDKMPNAKSSGNKEVGEYVEYEEID